MVRILTTSLRMASSARLTVALFLAFFALFVVGLVLPQDSATSADAAAGTPERAPALARIASAAGLDDVYRSPLMTAVLALFLVQLALFIATRTPRLLRELRALDAPPGGALPVRHDIPGGPETLEALARALARRRFAVRRVGDDALVAVRNRFSKAGTLLFHASFVVLLLAGWWIQRNAFSGVVALAEGQPFDGTLGAYDGFVPRDAAPSDAPAVSFALESVRPRIRDDGTPLDIVCRVQTRDANGPDVREIRVNQPYRRGSTAVLITRFGIAPVIAVRLGSSTEFQDLVCAKLDAIWGPGDASDSFRILRPPATVHARFLPNAVGVREGRPETRGYEIGDPLFHFRVVPDDPALPPAAEWLRPGEELAFGPHRLRLVEIRRWASFRISREPGGSAIYLGFAIMLAGALLRVLWLRSWVRAERSAEPSPTVRLRGRTEWFKESFLAEMDGLAAELGAETPIGNERDPLPPTPSSA